MILFIMLSFPKMSFFKELCWIEFLPKFNSRGRLNKNDLAGKILKNYLARVGRLLGTKGYFFILFFTGLNSNNFLSLRATQGSRRDQSRVLIGRQTEI